MHGNDPKNLVEYNTGKKILFTCAMWALVALVLAGAYVFSVFCRDSPLYRDCTATGRSPQKLYHADPALGFAPVPGSVGVTTLPIGPPVPVRFSKEGFRVPVECAEKLERKRPLVMALGCSFTFGYAVPAEDAFPFRVAQCLNGSEVNAGVICYGLSQMLILAERLIPKHRPDILLVQYSPWLATRSTYDSAKTDDGGIVPTPYFCTAADQSLKIQAPVFASNIYGIDREQYRNRAIRPSHLSFLFGESIRFFAYQDANVLKATVQKGLGLLQEPEQSETRVTTHVFSAIYRLCQEYKVTMVVVLVDQLTNSDSGLRRTKSLLEKMLPRAVFVNATAALERATCGWGPAARLSQWGQVRGDPPRVVDAHPNSKAHCLIAQAIAVELGHGTRPCDCKQTDQGPIQDNHLRTTEDKAQ